MRTPSKSPSCPKQRPFAPAATRHGRAHPEVAATCLGQPAQHHCGHHPEHHVARRHPLPAVGPHRCAGWRDADHRAGYDDLRRCRSGDDERQLSQHRAGCSADCGGHGRQTDCLYQQPLAGTASATRLGGVVLRGRAPINNPPDAGKGPRRSAPKPRPALVPTVLVARRASTTTAARCATRIRIRRPRIRARQRAELAELVRRRQRHDAGIHPGPSRLG